jgi:hypothetical protein
MAEIEKEGRFHVRIPFIVIFVGHIALAVALLVDYSTIFSIVRWSMSHNTRFFYVENVLGVSSRYTYWVLEYWVRSTRYRSDE